MVALDKACLLALCLSATATLTRDVRIVGDTDRNGVIDEKDINGREEYTESSGAVFMANIGDASGDCSKFALKATDEKMRQCNDARDDIQRNPKYLARVKILPLVDAPPGTSATITPNHRDPEQDDYVEQNVRVFKLVGDATRGEGWEFVNPDDPFKADELNAGIELAIDARSFRSDKWDGKARLSLMVYEGGTPNEYIDHVELRVAPLLIHHNLQKLEKVYTVSGKMVEDPFREQKQEQFVKDVIGQTGPEVQGNVVQFHDKDRWVQDWFESGYTSMPGAGGEPVVLRVMIRSTRVDNPQDRKVFTEMRSADTGAIQMSFPAGTTESQKASLYHNFEAMGNLELIPPYKGTDGTVYANGRVVTGSHLKHEKYYRTSMHLLFENQGLSPVDIDLTWTAAGHIDEILTVLPADNENGFVLAVADAAAGFKLLKKHKDIQVSMPHPDAQTKVLDRPPYSVADLIETHHLESFNEQVATKTQAVFDHLVNVAKFPAEHIVRVPMPFFQAGPVSEKRSWSMFHNLMTVPKINLEKLDAAPLYANFINGLVVNKKTYAHPIPWGPVVGGERHLPGRT